MAALRNTNVIVYRFDPRFPEKQRIATELLYWFGSHCAGLPRLTNAGGA